MGVSSNLEVFLSEKQECKIVTPEKHEVKPKQDQLVQEQDTNNKEDQENKEMMMMMTTKTNPTPSLCLNLKLEIPQLKEGYDEEDLDSNNNDGFKTPTSEEYKIPTLLQCPGAPKKRKTSPTKQEGGRHLHRRRHPIIVLDFTTQEIESALLPVDLGACGNHNNKNS